MPQFHAGDADIPLCREGAHAVSVRADRPRQIWRSGGYAMPAIAFFAVVSIATFVTSQSQAQDAAAGEKVFAKCKVCHVVDKDQNKVGPSLSGVIGRTAGTHPGFKYSKAMTEAGASGVKWDDATLTNYLRDPKAMIKGGKMAFPGLKKDEDLANVIAYLKQFSK
jgi:cytochrome c